MSRTDFSSLIVGAVAWVIVAVLAVVMQARVDDEVVGFVVVLAAVVIAWAAGEWATRAAERGRQ